MRTLGAPSGRIRTSATPRPARGRTLADPPAGCGCALATLVRQYWLLLMAYMLIMRRSDDRGTDDGGVAATGTPWRDDVRP